MEKVVTERTMMNQVNADFLANPTPYPGYIHDWWGRDWIPFLDFQGAYFCLAPIGSFGGREGQILVTNPSSGAHTILSSSLIAWLEVFVQGCEQERQLIGWASLRRRIRELESDHPVEKPDSDNWGIGIKEAPQ